MSLSAPELELYQRQIQLPELGLDGQQRLKQSRVLVIGAGGLGSPVLLYLAVAGVGTLGVAEWDTISLSNLNRQVLYGVNDVGLEKLKAASDKLQAFNPHIEIIQHREGLTEQNGLSLFQDYDLVIECSDLMDTKRLASRLAWQCKTPLVIGSIYQYEGYLLVVQPQQHGGCFRCLWPQIPEAIETCSSGGILGAVAGVFGTMQALEALKLLLDMESPFQEGKVLFLNLLNYQMNWLPLPMETDCPDCRECADSENEKQPTVLTISDLSSSERQNKIWLDIRSVEARKKWPLRYFQVVETSAQALLKEEITLDKSKPYIIVCTQGVQSRSLIRPLRQRGFESIHAWQGSIDALLEAEPELETICL